MTQDVALRLGELVRDRSDGRLSVAEYRRLRAPLLDRLVSQPAVEIDESSLVTRPRAIAPVVEPSLLHAAEGDGSDAAAVASVPRAPGIPWSRWVLVASIVAAAAILWARQRDEAGSQIDPVNVSVVAVAVPEPITVSVERPQRPKAVGSARRPPPAQAVTGIRESQRGERSSKTSSCDGMSAAAGGAACDDRLSTGQVGPRLLRVPVVGDAGLARGGGAFAVSAQAISQAQFRAYCEKTGTPFPRQPWVDGGDAVVNVTWGEALEYVRWLSRESGQRYRLPVEAEWLHAARALGERDTFSAGKVREWTQDTWIDEAAAGSAGPDRRVVRGASYADGEATLLSARRNLDVMARDALTGFRVVRDLPPRSSSPGSSLRSREKTSVRGS
jgi:hypothetical protein